MPAADEVNRLQRGKDTVSRLFQEFCEEGHYKGRQRPTDTRQGIYAVTPNGKFLASCNTRSANVVAKMLRRALDKWNHLQKAERRSTAQQVEQFKKTAGWERHYPDDGLVLRVASRDLPGAKEGRGWKGAAWTLDYAWFNAVEARAFLPRKLVAGTTHDVPRQLIRRLARLHLLDYVRGQVPSFLEADIQVARLQTKILKHTGTTVKLRLVGKTRAVRKGRWPVNGHRDRDDPQPQELGFETDMLGFATYDTKTKAFTAFELVAVGHRWGGTQYNGRSRSLEKGPIGVFLSLSSGDPDERVAPARIWHYGW